MYSTSMLFHADGKRQTVERPPHSRGEGGEPLDDRPFSVRPLLNQRFSPLVSGLLAPAVDGALALSRLAALYASAISRGPERPPFWDLALDTLNVTIDVESRDLDGIPRTGPLVVMANHPFGGVDGLTLLSVLHRVRPDVRLLGNRLLQQIPDVREALVFVETMTGQSAAWENASAMRRGLRWLEAGHALGVFPSGEVSHLDLHQRTILDPLWHPAAARLAQIAGAPILPVFFHGRNSSLFQAAGVIHRGLRTLLLPREVLKRRNTTVVVSIGGPIPASQVRRFETADDLTSYVRARTFVLRARSATPVRRLRPARAAEALAGAVRALDLRREVEALPADRQLLTSAPYSVWLARRNEIPGIVNEIGRLRELTFRKAGEGTGRASDLDGFDDHYLHLFVWNQRTDEVIGAYRLGQTDEIVPRLGAGGLYTNTLFQLRTRFLDQITPALELGRSFVRPEYQREFAPLMLLWKGIGQVVAGEPRYARLFGAVSISQDYVALSQQLLIAFLRSTRTEEQLAPLVSARHPPAVRPLAAGLVDLPIALRSDVDRLDELVREVERGERGIPVMLRQYLKLNAKVVGFSVDPAFGAVLDALMLVDLRTVGESILQRYMGRPGAARFLAFHERPERCGDARPRPPMIDAAPALA